MAKTASLISDTIPAASPTSKRAAAEAAMSAWRDELLADYARAVADHRALVRAAHARAGHAPMTLAAVGSTPPKFPAAVAALDAALAAARRGGLQ